MKNVRPLFNLKHKHPKSRWTRYVSSFGGRGSDSTSFNSPRSSGTWPADVVDESSDPFSLNSEVYRLRRGLDALHKQAILDEYLRGILDAQSRIYDVCKETELTYAPALSEMLGNDVYLKREDQQPVFSFKIRGAFNKIASLPEEKLGKGIVACSAGNHAQGVALSASILGIDNVIIMPQATPSIKVNAVRKFGGNVKLHGMNYDEAQAEALRLAKEEGRTLIHPFDDPAVICGQGTIGIEILKQMPSNKKIDSIFCCVGGGGLLAGISTFIKLVQPEIKMIGVEANDAAAMTLSIDRNEKTTLDEVGIFADGAAVRTPGENTFSLIRELNDGMITVNTDQICAAIKLGFNDTRSIFEPAGALAIAGLVKYVEETGVKGKTLVAISSGANMDFDRLRFVSERADKRESLLSVRIPEEPGSFWNLYNSIYPRNVTEFSYRCSAANAKDAHIIMSFQAADADDRNAVINGLSDKGFAVEDLHDNELAKTHIRYLAAGREVVENERIFRFEFPERPGALHLFLNKLTSGDRHDQGNFNVSLFHYRNHGADIGRVLVGIQVAPHESEQFERFLKELEFVYKEETDNPAYRDFLQ
eukprot:CAMPEP_0184011128 /NCGR_PEP_ID=MMETSP0954-20121128/3643_1 /TAXON_ID=627963 /ORGANISM="Aplanochytrium sp, Strain PBS07" /LENGTH=589 /DNA_ID=CAMNT_0026290887 /DNA_START=68 /DNA_END=1837 /DNA_ORIENTATION=-